MVYGGTYLSQASGRGVTTGSPDDESVAHGPCYYSLKFQILNPPDSRSIQNLNLFSIHKYTNTQIHIYSNTQIHKYTNTQIIKHTNT